MRVGVRWVSGGDGKPAVAIVSTSTVVGLHWQSVAAGADGFVASAPIEGKVELEGILITPQGVPVLEDPHRFQVALGSSLAVDQAGMDAGIQLFPRGSQASGSRYDLVVAWGSAGLYLPIGAGLNVNGLRFLGRWYNGGASSADAYLGIWLHLLVGGEPSLNTGFLSGEFIAGG